MSKTPTRPIPPPRPPEPAYKVCSACGGKTSNPYSMLRVGNTIKFCCRAECELRVIKGE